MPDMISFKLNTSQVDRSIRRLMNKSPQFSRKILSIISEAIVAHTVIHKLSGQVLKRQTGTLAKSINYKLLNDYKSVVGTNVVYGAIHEFGGVILPVNKQALHFKVKDQWVTTKQVIMPKRSYLAPSIEYVMREEATQLMNKYGQEFINKEWNV